MNRFIVAQTQNGWAIYQQDGHYDSQIPNSWVFKTVLEMTNWMREKLKEPKPESP